MIFSPYDNASCGDESIGFLVFAISLFPIILPSATIQPFNVGYQNKEIADSTAGGSTWLLSTLPSVGVSEEQLTLSSWVVIAPEGGLWSEGSVRMNTFNSAGQIEGDYLYLDDVQCAMFGVEAGWYTFESVANWAPESAGEVDVEAGEMFQIGSDCGATITVPSALPVAE